MVDFFPVKSSFFVFFVSPSLLEGDAVMTRLRRLTPSALDAEVRFLAPSREELAETFKAIDTDGSGGVALTANPYARLSAFLYFLLNRCISMLHRSLPLLLSLFFLSKLIGNTISGVVFFLYGKFVQKWAFSNQIQIHFLF